MGGTALVVSILLLVACLCLGYLAFRRVRLMRGGGVDVCLRRRPVSSSRPRDATAGWHFGVARYRGDEFAWFRLTSLRPGPTVVVDRTELEIVDRRTPSSTEAYVLPQSASVLSCRVRGTEIELAMPIGVLTGFLSWLEAIPPGRTGYRQAS
ncbi:hypothetical protein BJF78_20725 [Pseudonocardia sp. CNS-139]|nr:hypothetical protein BJF78_20725 [Pseudonocardia sp. CNS-139]